MSIQQSINQAISGSLYLLGQSTLFRTLKEERDLKVQRDRLEKEAKLNAPRDKGVNAPQPQEQGEQNAPVSSVQQNNSAVTRQLEEKNTPRYFPYYNQILDFDLQDHLQRKVAEASRTEQLSREFREQITGRGDNIGK